MVQTIGGTGETPVCQKAQAYAQAGVPAIKQGLARQEAGLRQSCFLDPCNSVIRVICDSDDS